jgi:hypothetical protein
MLKKVTLGLIAALGVSASALAAGPGADVPIPAAPASINVTAPVQQGSWEIGLEGAYLQSANSEMQYAQRYEGDNDYKNYSVQPSHHWGGHADVTFNIPGAGRYVQLAGSFLNSTDHDRVEENSSFTTGGVFAPLTGFLASQFFDFAGADLGEGRSKTNYSDVDLVFGQKIDVGARVRMKFYGGLRYASINTDNDGDYAIHDSLGNVTAAADYDLDSRFSGIGPRAGIDTEVNLAYGFSIIGRIAGSLLVGDVNQRQNYAFATFSGTTVLTSTEFDYHSSSDLRVIPEADARIGLHYDYGFSPDTSVGLEVGYQVVNYFGPEELDAWDMVLPNTTRNTNDYGFHGFYLRAQVNMA